MRSLPHPYSACSHHNQTENKIAMCVSPEHGSFAAFQLAFLRDSGVRHGNMSQQSSACNCRLVAYPESPKQMQDPWFSKTGHIEKLGMEVLFWSFKLPCRAAVQVLDEPVLVTSLIGHRDGVDVLFLNQIGSVTRMVIEIVKPHCIVKWWYESHQSRSPSDTVKLHGKHFSLTGTIVCANVLVFLYEFILSLGL